jgi:hypothetical protein
MLDRRGSSWDSLPCMLIVMWGCRCGVFSWGVLEVTYIVKIWRISGLGWALSVEWCRVFELCSVTTRNGKSISLWIVDKRWVFQAYQRASVVIIIILFWSTLRLRWEFHMAPPYSYEIKHCLCFKNVGQRLNNRITTKKWLRK